MRSHLIPINLFVLAVTVQLVLAHLYGYIEVDGEAHWLASDDVMISQRYARNLVRGNGLVLNPGERVEGFSNPLMLLAVSVPVELFATPRSVGLWLWILNALLQGAIAVLIAGHGSRGRPAFPRLLLALIYLSLPHHAYFSESGLSVYAQGLALLIMVARWQRGGPLFWIALALYPLVHGVCLPLWLALVGARLWLGRERWRVEAMRIAAAATPLAAYVLFRLAYYGELFPNTFYLRSGGPVAFGPGLLYLGEAALWLAPLLGLGAFLILLSRGTAARPLAIVAAVLGPYLLYVATLGGDSHPWYRFVLPLVPALAWAIGRSLDRLPRPHLRVWVVAGALLACQLGVAVYGYAGWHLRGRATRAWLAQRVSFAYALDAHARPDDVVALFSLGHLSYFSHRRVIDMLGRADHAIARMEPKPWRKPAHQKDDPAGVMARAPAFVQCRYPSSQLRRVDFLERQAQTFYGYDANLALDPTFRRDYVPVRLDGREIEFYARRGRAAASW